MEEGTLIRKSGYFQILSALDCHVTYVFWSISGKETPRKDSRETFAPLGDGPLCRDWKVERLPATVKLSNTGACMVVYIWDSIYIMKYLRDVYIYICKCIYIYTHICTLHFYDVWLCRTYVNTITHQSYYYLSHDFNPALRPKGVEEARLPIQRCSKSTRVMESTQDYPGFLGVDHFQTKGSFGMICIPIDTDSSFPNMEVVIPKIFNMSLKGRNLDNARPIPSWNLWLAASKEAPFMFFYILNGTKVTETSSFWVFRSSFTSRSLFNSSLSLSDFYPEREAKLISTLYAVLAEGFMVSDTFRFHWVPLDPRRWFKSSYFFPLPKLV